MFEDAARFQAMQRFPDKKVLIHRFEAWLDSSDEERKKDWRLAKASTDDSARTSRWDFDRVAFYLCRERTDIPTLDNAVGWLRMELEKARANNEGSHMPLTYCLAPPQKAIERMNLQSCDARVVLEAREHLGEVIKIGKTRKTRRNEQEPSGLWVEAEKTRAFLDERARARS